MAPGPRLIVNIAEKRFAGMTVPLLENLVLDVAPGNVVAVLGPSGIGKSTLLRLVAGIDEDFTGSITLDGIALRQAPPPGFVFQDARLLPWLTALDNVRAADPAMTPGDARAMLDQVGLLGHAAAYPRALSGGMQRRVALARALAVNAKVLLLDEPFVSLDRALVLDLQELLKRLLAASQPTVLFVTHVAEDAARLADRVVMLAGRPAGIVADLALEVPPARRDATLIETYLAMIEKRVPPASP